MSTGDETSLPKGFVSYVANIGIKDDSSDFTVVIGEKGTTSAGVFTQSLFAGPSVHVSRANNSGSARAMVVISKNANVATGDQGLADAREVASSVADRLGIAADSVLIASTGVIGRAYPMDRVRAGIAAMPSTLPGNSADDVARGIMTTDTVRKVASAAIAGTNARVVGVAKGVGMIEPNMATLISMVFTDARLDSAQLDTSFRAAVNATLNCLSIDSDTSTSDTAVMFASGAAGVVPVDAFEAALRDVLQSLTKQIARDGEGAEKLIEVRVDGARDDAQAKRVAKSIVNSPLVKTAVHGADPNWGRVAMAIGKCSDDTDIAQDRVTIRFGSQEVYPTRLDQKGLDTLSKYMRGAEVLIHVSLGVASGASTVWGCDLTDGYVRINADYTT